MPNFAQGSRTRLCTCRYWALSDRCPNVDAFGSVVCDFAHYDTGRLAGHLQQRGTCLQWKHYGFCGRMGGCWYEHRDTGVTGLYQGTIELEGFELQIADAATKANFNTFSHEALFDLIWAVKRLALRTGKVNMSRLPPPPRDPIYPDRYRPSGIGDNTNKKRRATPQPPLFHPNKPLMRKRPLDDSKLAVIDLTADSEPDELLDFKNPPSPAKRQKMATRGNTTVSNALSKTQRKRGNRQVKAAQTMARTENTTPAFSGPPLTAANVVPVVPRKPQTAREQITSQLLSVKARLDDAKKTMNTCQAKMKSLFDSHYTRFDNDQMMTTLQKLSNNMNKAYDGGKDGVDDVDRAIALLNDIKDEIL